MSLNCTNMPETSQKVKSLQQNGSFVKFYLHNFKVAKDTKYDARRLHTRYAGNSIDYPSTRYAGFIKSTATRANKPESEHSQSSDHLITYTKVCLEWLV